LVNGCHFVPIDADGDEHAAASCVTDQGEALGDDCDDADINRYPGNAETCTPATEAHDEDCNPNSVGARDADGDTAIDMHCCNGTTCGDDCDDSEPTRGPDYPEICDVRDNDCDEGVDEDAVSVPWYVDSDGDGFGSTVETPIVSCAPVLGRSLFGTDCDALRASINPAATEICDGVDNDCDQAVDERDVCSCGVQGAEPCECVSGNAECFGGLIPRNCVSGHWVASGACGGVTPICAMGHCVCADGGTSCIDVIDRSPPFVLAMAPSANLVRVPTSAVVVVVLSEPPAASSVNATTFRVFDDNDVAVAGARTVDGQLVSFTSDQPLLPGHIYNVVFEDVTDRAGNAMRSTTSWRFATALGSYPREVVLELTQGNTGGFREPVLRVSPTGDVALWVDTSWSCSDCIYHGNEIYRRALNGVWSGTGWPHYATSAPPWDVGNGGLIASLSTDDQSPFDLLRQAATDTVWDLDATVYAGPRAIAVAGDQVVSVAQTTNGLLDYFEVATASGSAPLSTLYSIVYNGIATDVAVAALDADTIAVFALTDTQVIAAYYANGIWNTTFASAIMASKPSVALHANGTAVASWLQLEQVVLGPQGPVGLFPTQNVAFFDASNTTLTPISMVTRSSHTDPQVSWLDDTSIIASHTEPRGVANVVSTNGTIVARYEPQGRLDGSPTSATDLAVLPNGDAVATWIQATSLFGPATLVIARYVNGLWLPVEAIAEAPSNATPQIEALPDNTALLTWGEINPSRGVSIVIK
jgi:hypothetical protein